MSLSKLYVSAARTQSSSTATTLTSASFDSTGYTHCIVISRFEGNSPSDATTIAITDNKGSGTYSNLTMQKNGDGSTPVFIQIAHKKIGTPGTSMTVTQTLSAARGWRGLHVYLLNATSGEISLVDEDGATAVGTDIDAGSLVTGSVATASFMGVGPFAGGLSYTPGTGWTEDFDGEGGGGSDYSYAQSRTDASGTINPICTVSTSMDWAAVSASFSESGGTAYTITADQGSYSLTGQTANLARAYVPMTANQGSYGLTGQDATLSYVTTRTLPAEYGLYTLVGSEALVDLAMNAELGEYDLNGQVATLNYAGLTNRTITAEQGSYSLTGQDINMFWAHVLQALQGTYNLTGTSVILRWSEESSAGGIVLVQAITITKLKIGL